MKDGGVGERASKDLVEPGLPLPVLHMGEVLFHGGPVLPQYGIDLVSPAEKGDHATHRDTTPETRRLLLGSPNTTICTASSSITR